MAYKATHRHAQISARKVRPLADLVRGKRVDDALAILKYQPQRGARLLEKVIKSALGNAEDQRAPNVAGRRSDVQASPPASPWHGPCGEAAVCTYFGRSGIVSRRACPAELVRRHKVAG
jgi:hypothetical protein